MVYDLTNRQSFQSLDFFYKEIEDYAPKDVNIILLGNKSDLSNQRQVSFSEANEWVQNKNITYYEVSAKLDLDKKVNLAFKEMTKGILNKINES